MKEAHGGPNVNSSGVMHACNVDFHVCTQPSLQHNIPKLGTKPGGG